MKAVQIDEYGGPEVLQPRDVPEPVAGPGDLLVDIYAASLNPGDIKVRKGLRPEYLKNGFPHTLGRDFSGVVRSVGRGVEEFKAGDSVFAVLELGQEGAYADAITINSAITAKKPAQISHVEAVSVALTGITALFALEDEAAIKAGETILIHGGSGGIGSFSVQYCKHIGAYVLTTASARNHAYVRELGADEVIDYATEDFTRLVPQCDVVFDMIGGEVQKRSLQVLRSGGRLVSIAPSISDIQGMRADITILRPLVRRDRKHLDRIAELVIAGAVRPPPIKRLPLSQARTGHELAESGNIRGKIVFEVR